MINHSACFRLFHNLQDFFKKHPVGVHEAGLQFFNLICMSDGAFSWFLCQRFIVVVDSSQCCQPLQPQREQRPPLFSQLVISHIGSFCRSVGLDRTLVITGLKKKRKKKRQYAVKVQINYFGL